MFSKRIFACVFH